MTDVHPIPDREQEPDLGLAEPVCGGAGAVRQLTARLRNTEQVLSSWAQALGVDVDFARQLGHAARHLREAVKALREPAPVESDGAELDKVELPALGAPTNATGGGAFGLRGRSDMIDLVEFVGFVAGLNLDGVLSARARNDQYLIEFKEGRVVWVGGKPLAEHEQLGAILVEQNALDEHELQLVLSSQRPNEFLGEALLRFRLLDAATLRRALEEQAVRLFQRIHRAGSGFDFEFEECSRVPEPMALRVGTTSLLLESARRLDEADPNGASASQERAVVDRFRKGLEAIIARDDLSLPVLPDTTAQLLALCWSEDADPKTLVEYVATDQALCAHLLRTANSSAYAPTTPISSVQLAVSRLGVKTLREIAMSLALRQTVFSVDGWEEVVEELWRLSSSNSRFGGAVGRRCGVGELRGRMLGLLQDVGKPVVLRALQDIAEESDLELTIEVAQTLMEEFHASLGAYLADRWKLPEWLSGAMRHHHQFDLADEHRLEAMVANLAAEMTQSTTPGGSKTAEDLQNLEVCAALGLTAQFVHEILGEGHQVV